MPSKQVGIVSLTPAAYWQGRKSVVETGPQAQLTLGQRQISSEEQMVALFQCGLPRLF